MRLALAHPGINFQLINEGKTIFNLKSIQEKEEALRFDHFCNENFSKDSLFLLVSSLTLQFMGGCRAHQLPGIWRPAT